MTAARHVPPAHPAWDLALDEAPLAFVDLEMTGLDASVDRVCEVCVIRTRGRTIEATLESLVNPGARGEGNVAIHGLDAAALATAPTFDGVAPRMLELLDGALFVAHAAEYDTAFVAAELARLGLEPNHVGVLDTLPLSRRAFALPSHKLSFLAKTLSIPLENAHRAGDDARATMALFFRIAEVLAAKTARDLWHVRIGERHARPEVLEAALEAAAAGQPVTVRHRPARRPAEEISMVITAVRTDLDPPRVLGYLHPGRGRKELRADRILAILL